MPQEIIYCERGDLIYPIKFIVDRNIELSLPIRGVVRTLERFGFVDPQPVSELGLSSRRTGARCIGLSRDNVRCQITETEVAFSSIIPDDEIEKIKAELHALLVTRVEILSNAAEQNASSALINLLQNQRRACVSDIYYALHNAISALQEHYLFQGTLDVSRLPEELSRETAEEESRLGHCSPAIAKPIFSAAHLDTLWESDPEDILTDTHLRAGSDARDRDAHRSPFIWLSIMFRELFRPDELHGVRQTHRKETEDLATQIRQKLVHLELESLGIGGKNDAIENHFKELHQDALALTGDIPGEGSSDQFRLSVLTHTDFLMFAQILRLSGDYDSSFEIKIRLRDIIDWTLISVRVVNLIRSFISGRPLSTESTIQHLPTRCDHRLLGIPHPSTEPNLVASLGGAIQAPGFDLVDVVRRLHNLQGYNLTRLDGRTESVHADSEEITLWKSIPGLERLVCFLTLHRNGLFWYRIVDSPFDSGSTRFRKMLVNTYYLNLLIDRMFVEVDLLSSLQQGSVVYRGISESFQLDESPGYAYMLHNLADTHYAVTFQISRLIERIFSARSGLDARSALQIIWIRSRFDLDAGRIRTLLSPRRQQFFQSCSQYEVILVLPLIQLSSQDQELIENNVREVLRQHDQESCRLEFLTSESIDSALLGDTTLLEALIATSVERSAGQGTLDIAEDAANVHEEELDSIINVPE